MQLSIILPTYNEAGNIGKLILALIKQLRSKLPDLEIIVVDDNSPDGTAQVVKNLVGQKIPVKLFVRKNQRGLATAIHLGIKKSAGEIIVLMDTDFNHQPKDVPRLLQPIFTGSADIVIGSRYISGGGMHKAETGTIHFFGSKFGSLVVNKLLLNLPFNESLSGFIAFKREILKKLNQGKIFHGYGDYCLRLLYQAHQQRIKIIEIPVFYGKRQWGKSKTRLLKVFFGYFKAAVLLKLGL